MVLEVVLGVHVLKIPCNYKSHISKTALESLQGLIRTLSTQYHLQDLQDHLQDLQEHLQDFFQDGFKRI